MASTNSENTCFHCQLPVPTGTKIYVLIDGENRAMCCHGCQAVTEAIIKGGMADFYRYRTASPGRPEELVPAFLDQFKIYDKAIVQQHFIEHPDASTHNDPDESDIREVALILEGIVSASPVSSACRS